MYDPNFGIASRIYLDQITLLGQPVNSVEVPNSLGGVAKKGDPLVTSFSSKSEPGLHLSTNGQFVTFSGYVAPVDAVDVSNSNTLLAIDPTNQDGTTPTYRAIARIGANGDFRFTETNAYSGNNSRNAILDNRGAPMCTTPPATRAMAAIPNQAM